MLRDTLGVGSCTIFVLCAWGRGTLAYHLLMGGQYVSPGLTEAERAGESVTILRCKSKCSLFPKCYMR